MKVLVASDLDRTLIYSREARELGPDDEPTCCVEVHDGKQTSFMTEAAAEQLSELARTTTVVPVTTRVVEQYRRVQLPGPPPPFAVAANGGVLLVDGAVDRRWTKRVARDLAVSVPLDEVWTRAAQVCHPEFTDKLRNASDLFCYAVLRPGHLPEAFVAEQTGWAAERGWRTSLQGRKLYWVPDRLSKSAAVREVADRIGAECLLAAGDSLLDVDLLLAADRGIHPRHGELFEQGWAAPTVTMTTASGITAGAEIVSWFSAGAASAVSR
jgi:hypothetical protein